MTTTELPTWAVYVISLGTPAAALAGVLWSQHITRKSAKELDGRAKREEVMRNLRWAAELAVDRDPRKSQLGVDQLEALADSDLLDDAGQGFIDAAIDSVLRLPTEELDELEDAGEKAEVLEMLIEDQIGLTDQPDVAVPLEAEEQREEDDDG